MSGTVPAPTITTTAGAIPRLPADLRAALVALAEGLAPGLVANLPASLIEDMASTATGAVVLLDQARVDTINSLTPFGANPFTAKALGQLYLGQGSTASPASNTSVYVIFTGTVGFLIPPGFLVADGGGGNQYAVVDGTVIGASGISSPVFCLATQPGSFPVPVGTVTTLVTSVPGSITLSVTNALAGTAGGAAQTDAEYAAQVLQAGLVAATGMPQALKAQLARVPGVVQRLISVRQQAGGGWEVIVGGSGDPYAVAAAIFYALFDTSLLVGSSIKVTGITNAANGVVTTDLNHGYATGQVVTITGVAGMTGINGTPFTITVLTPKTFSLTTNTTSSGTWTSGGIVTPNFRNVSVSLNNYPDTYTIPFVIPPLQTVTMAVTWNTTGTNNFVSPLAITQLAQPALAAYINSIPVGAVINVLEMESVFRNAVSSIVDPVVITRLVFTVSINGIVTAPPAGTQAITGDPESYFSATAAGITVTQG